MKLWHSRLSRRRLLALGGALVAGEATGLRRVLAQTGSQEQIRIGVVTPTRTGALSITEAVYDTVGQAARMGALLAESEMGDLAASAGFRLDVLPSSSPSAEAAVRAAERMVALEELSALIGGLGEGQAEALAAVANDNSIPFFNIGSPSDALRGENCSPFSFHVEASAAMYLDALVAWHARAGRGRWFIVYEDTDEGNAQHRRAEQAVAKMQPAGEVVGAAPVVVGQPVYSGELDAIRQAEADAVLLLAGVRDQIPFLAQAGSAGLELPVAAFPHPVTQARDYFATVRRLSGRAGQRLALWETTLATNGAAELNDRYTSRWGEPMNPSAWATYQAVKIVVETIAATGSREASDMIRYLESPDTVFDLQKGPGTSFRPWDHQLRQPLYMVDIDPEAPWGITLSEQVAIAELAGEVPAPGEQGVDPIERLDRLGDGPGESGCNF